MTASDEEALLVVAPTGPLHPHARTGKTVRVEGNNPILKPC
jgi:hypothetical protein